MGRRGPAPKPTALRLVDGNAAHRPLPANEPVPERGPLVMPPAVAADKGAAAEWNRIVPMMERCGLVRALDSGMVALWCLTWSQFSAAAAWCTEKGTYYPVKNRHGDVVRVVEWPQTKQFRNLQDILIRLSRELGMSPSARSRVQSVGDEIPGFQSKGSKPTQDQLRDRYFRA